MANKEKKFYLPTNMTTDVSEHFHCQCQLQNNRFDHTPRSRLKKSDSVNQHSAITYGKSVGNAAFKHAA